MKHCLIDQFIIDSFTSNVRRNIQISDKALVLNIVEYCCPLWSPHRIQDIARIESVQRRFTAKISSVCDLDYWERLKQLKLMSLQRRRERYQIIYMWKLINGKAQNDCSVQ